LKLFKIFILLCSILSGLFAVVNLGKYGQTYEIIEPDMYKEIMAKAKDFNKSKVVKAFYHSINRYLKPDFDINNCNKNNRRILIPMVRIPINVLNKEKQVIIRAGTYVNPLRKGLVFSKYIVFINANDPVQASLAKMLQSEATIIVVKGNMQRLFKKNITAYKANKRLINNFGLKCVPSVYTQKKYNFIINEYNPKKLIRKE